MTAREEKDLKEYSALTTYIAKHRFENHKTRPGIYSKKAATEHQCLTPETAGNFIAGYMEFLQSKLDEAITELESLKENENGTS
jgi:hypothetical protein